MKAGQWNHGWALTNAFISTVFAIAKRRGPVGGASALDVRRAPAL